MINTIIFDFGDIFINLDKQATVDSLKKLGLKEWNEDLNQLNILFEKGQISREDFLLGFQKQMPNASIDEILSRLECRSFGFSFASIWNFYKNFRKNTDSSY